MLVSFFAFFASLQTHDLSWVAIAQGWSILSTVPIRRAKFQKWWEFPHCLQRSQSAGELSPTGTFFETHSSLHKIRRIRLLTP
jgi:hypothetical protein